MESKSLFTNMVLEQYIGESTYFSSGGRGKGIFFIANDLMRTCQPATHIKGFREQFNNKGLLGFYIKGIKNSQLILQNSIMELKEKLTCPLDKNKVSRAKLILKREFMTGMECQYDRLENISNFFINGLEMDFNHFESEIEKILLMDVQEHALKTFSSNQAVVVIKDK